MPVSLTNNEKLQLALFQLMDKKAIDSLLEDSCEEEDIVSTKYQCILLSLRKMCQVYKDLQDDSVKSKKLRALIISYLKIIYHSNIPETVKAAILKFLKSPSVKKCDGIISAIYALNIEDFSLNVLSVLITHINRGNPLRAKRINLYKKTTIIVVYPQWSRRQDSNLRPLGPKPSALPSCATSRNIDNLNGAPKGSRTPNL